MKKQVYVCGFLFNTAETDVALIRKEKPEWQKGKYNGIGGKVEDGETIHRAMQREFKEEACVEVLDWNTFCRYEGTSFVVYFMRSFSDKIWNVESGTEEQVYVHPLGEIDYTKTISNLEWLIPLALDHQVAITHVQEYEEI